MLFLFFVCAAHGIITGCIPSLEAFPKEVLPRKPSITLEPKVRWQKNQKFDIQRVNFSLHFSLRHPFGWPVQQKKVRNGSCRFVGSVEGLFPFHWYGDCEGVSVCLSASARKNKWHFSIASTQCWNIVPVYKWSQRHFLCSMLSCIHSSTDLCDHISIAECTWIYHTIPLDWQRSMCKQLFVAKWRLLGSDPLTEPVPEASLAPLRSCEALSQRPMAEYYCAVGSMMPAYVAKKISECMNMYIYI